MKNKYTTNPTWHNSIKNFFRKGDIECMEMRGFYLNEYESVKADIEIIFEAILSGDMPPDQPWSNDKIEAFQKWKDSDCPIGSELKWTVTNSPQASSRYDDVFFVSPSTGWAVNSNGQILRTDDSGRNWTHQFQTPNNGRRPIYLRCISFANEQRGWIGTFEKSNLVYHTTNGGQAWSAVQNLPIDSPEKICGIYAVSDSIIYASGTNNPRDHAKILKTTDSGNSWDVIDMANHADSLIDIFFFDENHGYVVGGKTIEATPSRQNVKPVILETKDGGLSWVNKIENLYNDLPLGEWGWKIQFLDKKIGFVSLENFEDGAIIKTTDGGATWKRLPINDSQKNKNLEGIGFISENEGWVGGWGDSQFKGGYSSFTSDGGQTWKDSNEIGSFINRFRFFGTPVYIGYSCGSNVYRYSDFNTQESTFLGEQNPYQGRIEFDNLDTIDVWDHFGNLLLTNQKNESGIFKLKSENELLEHLSTLKPESPLLIIRWSSDNVVKSKAIKLPPTMYKRH